MSGLHLTIAVLSGIGAAAWFILVSLSIFVRPKPKQQGTRTIEVMLIVASAFLLCCFGTALLLLRVRGAL